MGLFGPSGAEAARVEEEKKARMEKIRQIKAQMQDDDGFIVETKTSFFGLVKTVTRVPKPTLEERLTDVTTPFTSNHTTQTKPKTPL
jgi:hypothetical protein